MMGSVESLLPPFVYVLAVSASFPVSLIALRLARRRLMKPMLGATLAVVVLLVAGAVGTLAAVASPDAAIRALAVAVTAGGAFVVVPLGIGTVSIQILTGFDDDHALRLTTVGWPVGLLASFAVFVAPGGLTGTNITSLAGDARIAAFLLWGALIAFGPTLVGLAVGRVRGEAVGRSVEPGR